VPRVLHVHACTAHRSPLVPEEVRCAALVAGSGCPVRVDDAPPRHVLVQQAHGAPHLPGAGTDPPADVSVRGDETGGDAGHRFPDLLDQTADHWCHRPPLSDAVAGPPPRGRLGLGPPAVVGRVLATRLLLPASFRGHEGLLGKTPARGGSANVVRPPFHARPGRAIRRGADLADLVGDEAGQATSSIASHGAPATAVGVRPVNASTSRCGGGTGRRGRCRGRRRAGRAPPRAGGRRGRSAPVGRRAWA
jgi:hypothetical protein